MSQDPGMMEQRWDIGYKAAIAANEAFDRIQEVASQISILEGIVDAVQNHGVAGVTIDPTADDDLWRQSSRAEDNFSIFDKIVGETIGRDVLGEDFGQTEADEVIEQREVDEATTEKVNTLPAEMRAQVSARQFETYVSTQDNIRTGKLPVEYRFPELSEFIDDILALAPTFEKIQELGGTPAVEFFERGLTDEQAHATLSGHKLANEQVSDGVYRTFSEDKLTTPEGTAQKEVGYWGVVVIDATEKPAIRGISADGKNAIDGVNAKEVIKTLKTLPDVTTTKDTEAVVAQASPSEAAYRGVQRRRLERGEAPLDAEGWTIGKENVNWGDGSVSSAFFSFYPTNRRVSSGRDNRDSAYGDFVVRVSGER